MKRFVSIVLSIALILALVPGTAFAAEDNVTCLHSVKEAGKELREAMVARDDTAVFHYAVSADAFTNAGIKKLCSQIYNEAVKHTGNPKEGDYLKYVVAGYSFEASATAVGDTYDATLTFHLRYYTTASQETQLNAAIEKAKKSLALHGKTEYEKVKAVHDYMIKHVSYDYDALQNGSSSLSHTAYSALVKGKAVCQGYATLFYRMALEYGIDCRIITGTSNKQRHAWNIVELDGKWYNLDSTWDDTTGSQRYFLKGSSSFTDHVRDNAYTGSAFTQAYPTSGSDYKVVCKTHTKKTAITRATTAKDGKIVTSCKTCGKVFSTKTIRRIGKVTLSYTLLAYNGKSRSPVVIAKDANGNRISSSYYTVSVPYGRKNVGTYTYKVTFKGNYSGTVSIRMMVVPKAPTLKSLSAGKKSFTAKWSEPYTSQVTGYQIQYSGKSNFSSDKRLVTLKGAKVSAKKINVKKSKKRYYVRVRAYKTIGGKTYYSSWSAAKSIKSL